ncbi:hypothetical protein MRB53_001578 [Persea americana]|uniref:Uncharacterized protein n=1 Tax=Persea americana TaxID=3435 RepID=A0ACC2MSD5_PERAE|nr:hypothetical protein MRB53_001578 [Persea americana]
MQNFIAEAAGLAHNPVDYPVGSVDPGYNSYQSHGSIYASPPYLMLDIQLVQLVEMQAMLVVDMVRYMVATMDIRKAACLLSFHKWAPLYGMESLIDSQEDSAGFFEFILLLNSLDRLDLPPSFISLVSSHLSSAGTGTMDSVISKVADAGLGSLFQSMFDTLTPNFLQSLGFLFKGVEGEAQKLKSTLSRIQALLNDAEARHFKEELVRLWLRELKDAAYDAEDIVDEVEYQVRLRSKIEGAHMQTRKRKLTDPVSDFVSSSVSNLNLGPRIKEIRESLEEIECRSNQLHLKVMLKSEMLTPAKRRPTSSIIEDEPIVFGRETDREKVVGLLTADGDYSAANSGIQVVPICGMGGLGKTTLAQLAYNDERVVKHFVVKVWVYVSQDFDLMRLTKAIAESVPGSNPHLTNLDAIQVSIKEALKEKRFLLVLDDVWNENCNDWDALRAPLMFGARGSRILVTTRSKTVSQRVSSNMGTVPTHFLRGLSDDDSWSLFERRAFVDGDSDTHPDLVKIGKEIVNKCNGLPLAVKTLGGLSCSAVDVDQWEKILKSEIWELPEEGNDILHALRLSYHHLPAHLKRCFAYCGCLIDKGQWGVTGNKLILQWMAQGFIQPKRSTSEQMEDIGREYLADLVSRSLLNCRETDGHFYYTMHDLTHDLARSVLGADLWKIGDEKSHGNNAEKARYMSDDIITSYNFYYFYRLKNLRALSLLCTENIPADLFIKLRHIRTLRLGRCCITELPESIGDLLQLRYLDLSDAKIERLPKSTTRLYNLQTLKLTGCNKLAEVPELIGDLLQLRYLSLYCTDIVRLPKSTTRLYNLQTLDLSECQRLVELPSDWSNLVNLRHLRLSCFTSVSIPPRIGTLKGLQTLSYFNVGKEIGRGINELKDLIHLRGSLRISELENVVDVEEAKEVQLKNKQKIDKLELQWKCDDVESRQEGIEEEVLSALQPHTNLETLYIKGYCGVRFPTWLGDSSFSKLNLVKLSECRCRLLPPFGRLPSLQFLWLSNLYELKKVGREFYGDGTTTGFPPLKSLSLYSMPDLEELSGLESDIRPICEIDINNCTKLSLSSLRYLTSPSSLEIRDFPNLTSLGNVLQHLTSLRSLEIADCPELTSLSDVDLPATLDDGLGNSNYSNPTCLPKGLQNLSLEYCPKIPSLPEELLTTLRSLRIYDCPLLEEKYLVLAEGGNGYRRKISAIPSICFPESLSSFLSLSIYRHRQRSSPAAAITTGSKLFLSSPLLFTAGSRVTGLVAEKFEWGNGDNMGLNYTKIPYRIWPRSWCWRPVKVFILAHLPRAKMMDVMAVDEAIWHGMKISEVDGTRSAVRNLKSVIYEIKL